jgi:hypothetical protein
MIDNYTQNRRKKLVVNKPLQSRLILGMALMPAVGLALIAILTAVWCTRVMDEAMASDAELPNLMPLFYLVIVFEVLAGATLLFNSLKVSHRVAGPAYRICRSLERIRAGDLTFTVKLRDGDHLTDVRDELNKLLDWLNENPPQGAVTRAMAVALAAEATTVNGTEQPAATTAPACATSSHT